MRYIGEVTGKTRVLKSIYRFEVMSGKGTGAKFDVCIADTNNDKRLKKAKDKLIGVLRDFRIIEDPDTETIEWVVKRDAPVSDKMDHCILLYDSINGVIE